MEPDQILFSPHIEKKTVLNISIVFVLLQVVTLTDGALSVSSGVTTHQPHPPKFEEKPEQNTSQFLV